MTIKLISLNKKILFLYIKFLILLFKSISVTYAIFMLPIKKHKLTLLKSPHIYKKSQEHFEISIYKSFITIKKNLSVNFINYLLLNKSSLIKLMLIRKEK